MTRIAETPHMDAVLKSLTPGEIGVIASVLDEDYGDDDMVDELTNAFMQEDVAVIDGEYPPAVVDMQERLAYHIVHVLKCSLSS